MYVYMFLCIYLLFFPTDLKSFLVRGTNPRRDELSEKNGAVFFRSVQFNINKVKAAEVSHIDFKLH